MWEDDDPIFFFTLIVFYILVPPSTVLLLLPAALRLKVCTWILGTIRSLPEVYCNWLFDYCYYYFEDDDPHCIPHHHLAVVEELVGDGEQRKVVSPCVDEKLDRCRVDLQSE